MEDYLTPEVLGAVAIAISWALDAFAPEFLQKILPFVGKAKRRTKEFNILLSMLPQKNEDLYDKARSGNLKEAAKSIQKILLKNR